MPKQIKVADSTHEKLHLIKKVNRTGSLDGAIIHMMQGAVDELNVIKREQVALTLEYEGYGNIDEYDRKFEVFDSCSRDVTFKELKNSDVGDMFEAPLKNHMYYSYDIATVVYTDDELVVVKLTTITELPWVFNNTEIRLLGVNLL